MHSPGISLGAGTLLAALGLTACTPETPPGEASPAATPEVYRDGQYTATGWYGSKPSHHEVTLTIDDNIITAVEITTPAEDETSLGYQQRFAAALPEAVVGRNIAELSIDRVAGSSGCSEGFMDALSKIRNAAAQ